MSKSTSLLLLIAVTFLFLFYRHFNNHQRELDRQLEREKIEFESIEREKDRRFDSEQREKDRQLRRALARGCDEDDAECIKGSADPD